MNFKPVSHLDRLERVHGHRLLAHDVQAAIQAGQSHGFVKVIGHGQADGIDFRFRHKILEVRKHLRHVELGPVLLCERLVPVADGLDFRGRMFDVILDMKVPHAEADDSDANFFLHWQRFHQ